MPLYLAKIHKNSHSLSAFAAQRPTGQRQHAVLAPRLGHRRAVLGWAQGNHDPGLGVTAFSFGIASIGQARKIHL
jgi:hypothetical protein